MLKILLYTRQLFIFLLLLFFSYIKIIAQPNSHPFLHLNSKNGLSNGHVNAMLKDKQGFMWICTDAGLNKYDGYTFKVFTNNKKDVFSISNDYALAIIEDKDGNIWVGTETGLDKFNKNNETFTHYNPGKPIVVNNILLDSKGLFWLSTDEGFYQFNSVNNSFTCFLHNSNNKNSLSDNFVYKIEEDADNIYWIATKNGLNKFDNKHKQFTHFNTNTTPQINSSWVRTIYKDHRGLIWIGMVGGGIAYYNKEENNFVSYVNGNTNSLCHNDVLSITQDAKQQFWIGTENGGISIFNFTTKSFVTLKNNPFDKESLSNNSIYSLYNDNLGNMWVGTWSGGINLYPYYTKKFYPYTTIAGSKNCLSNPSIISVAHNNDNNIWIGTDGGGLNTFDTKTKNFNHILNEPNKPKVITNNYITGLMYYDENKIAIGYHRGSFDIFNTNTKKVEKHVVIKNPNNPKIEMSVNSLFKDNKGNIWIGTWGDGILVYDKKLTLLHKFNHVFSDTTTISSDFVNCFYQMDNGDIWIGTTQGLNIISGNKVIKRIYSVKKNVNSLSHNEVNKIFKDKDNTIWLATSGGLDAVTSYTSNFIHYTKSNGLPSNFILSILQDKKGLMWIGSNSGISCLNPYTKQIRNYTIADGIQGKEFNFNASFINKNGYIFMGGTEGFNYFNPDSLQDNKTPPPVYITNLQIFNTPILPGEPNGILKSTITLTKNIELSYKHSVITIEFAALNYAFSEQNEYAYMLEGFDNDWIYAGTKKSVTYTNLDAGKYTFRVKAKNIDDTWNDEGAVLEIIVTPPFWKSWWFLSTLLFATIFSILFYHQNKINRINNAKLLLEQKVNEQTIELIKNKNTETQARIEAENARYEADLANEKLLQNNKEMEQFAYIASHDLKEPLRTTTSFIELIQKKYTGKLDAEADKYLHFITASTNRMKRLIDDLLEFSKIGSTKSIVAVNCNELIQILLKDLDTTIKANNCNIQISHLPTLNGIETELKLLFQNLLTNAIKFRKKDTALIIKISCIEKENYWKFSVSDNGIGIKEEYFEKIFKIFHRLHSKDTYEGSGIGLAHCAKIVSLHNGNIWVDSTIQEGSTFYFTISKRLELTSNSELIE